MGVLQLQSLSMSLLLKLIDTIAKISHLMFLLHKFLWHENAASSFPETEKNLSSSFLVQSDKLVLVFHFPIVPVHTVVKPASYVIARLRGPSRAASQCSLPNRKVLFQYGRQYLILWVDQNPVELDPFGLVTCGGVEFRRITIPP